MAHTQHEDPIAENPVELGQVLDRVTRQIYNRLAPRLDTATPSRRLGEGPFRLIALRSSGKGQPPLTALIFTSASTMPAVGILLGRLIRPH